MPGDANGDAAVDVSDLGILAANYGRTAGAAWSDGDFNRDGKVDVADLGILAANYGTGTEAGDLSTEKEKTTGQACSSAGIPLAAGIFLAGLWLGNLNDMAKLFF